MSCDTRHRAIITDLPTLAGLRGTVDTATGIRSGSGCRQQRGGLLVPESHPILRHEDVRTAMGSIGHDAHIVPSWGASTHCAPWHRPPAHNGRFRR